MFESLIDNLSCDQWKEIPPCDKCNDGFKEYHVNKHHKVVDNTTIQYMIAEEDGDAKTVVLKNIQASKDPLKKDPLKQIGRVELQLNEDETEIIGIDLDGDIVVCGS